MKRPTDTSTWLKNQNDHTTLAMHFLVELSEACRMSLKLFVGMMKLERIMGRRKGPNHVLEVTELAQIKRWPK